jgi:methylated-DNA-[protein]-cysteine S-methyltransferase
MSAKTKIGKLILGSFDGKLCVLDFEYRKIVDSRIKKNLKAEFVEQDTQVLRETRKQLDEYSRNN